MPTLDEYADKPHYVYRLYDRQGALLYVGCTVNLVTRRYQHRAKWAWFPDVASWTITGPFDGRDRGRAAEAAAIQAEKPRYNSDPAESGRIAHITRTRGYKAGHRAKWGRRRCPDFECPLCRKAVSA